MSGQWEVVGKKKDKNSKVAPQSIKENKKKFSQNVPKVEEVLPMSQVKNLYKATKTNKENQKPLEKPKTQENGTTKKPHKKTEKQHEPPKPKPPKSIESALNSIDVDEFKNIYESSKSRFPDAPVVWLKDLVQFLNQKVSLDVQDPIFSTKPESYPFCMVPQALKNVIEKSVKEVGKSNAQLFFDTSLTAMAMDMSKGFPALGYKLYLQYLAISDSKVVATNLNKYIVLRNSYQNRQAIGLSIIWVLGQAGIKDFHVGLRVFQEMMLPLIEMKSYSRYVVKYLIDLINRHDDESITKEQYQLILDVVYSNKKNFPLDLNQELNKIASKLKPLLFAQSTKEKYYSCVEIFLKKLKSDSKLYKDNICDVLVDCFNKDPATFGAWTKNYTKNLPQSAILLNYISDNWKSISTKFNKKALSDILNTFSVTNDELSLKKRKEEGLLDCINAIKKLASKMTTQKGSTFPFKTILFLIILLIAGFIHYDIKQEGSWEKSKTRQMLIDSGSYDYATKAFDRTKQGASWINNHIEENYPEYYSRVVRFCEPYVKLGKELSVVFCNMLFNIKEAVVEKYPVVLASIDSYAPGLLEQSQKAVHNVWSTSVLYYNQSVDYLKKEVFVGQLSPENMQRVVLEAFNTTQKKATEYYHWLYEKVQTTIK